MKKTKRIALYFVLVIFFTIFNFYLRPVHNPLIDDEYRNSTSYINDLYKSDEYFKKHVLTPDEYHIYEEFIQKSINNELEVTIECHKECADAFYRAYYAVYLDHPELLSWLGIKSYHAEGTTIIYRNNNFSKLKTFLGTRRIERELDNVRRDTKNMNDREKILYVYNYVAAHYYDQTFKYSSINQSIYSFFTKGSSVCAGFAKVSQILFQNIGINSYLVRGNNHLWNYVEYEGKYYIFDATMGASFIKESSKYYDGLGETTIHATEGMFQEYYPKIETKKTLRQIFGV